MYIILFAVSSCINGRHKNDTSCGDVTYCKCQNSKIYGTTVDCSGVGLNITEVCSICSNISNITTLDLSYNSLDQIPELCFQDCKVLKTLSLKSNQLDRLKNKTFEGLANLIYLNLDNNALLKNGELSDPDFLSPLLKLQELHLQTNVYDIQETANHMYLSTIPAETLDSLHTLYLDILPYAKFGTNFKNLSRLQTISFSCRPNCPMVSLTNESFVNIASVTHLNLSYCNITTIENGTFACLRELTYLDLSYNMVLGFITLRNISYDLQFTKIEVLNYTKVYKTFGTPTRINKCDICFLANTTLKELHFSRNRICDFEIDALAYLPPELETLVFEYNKITIGPYLIQMRCLDKLKRLELNSQFGSIGRFTDYNDELYIHEKNVSATDVCQCPSFPTKPNCTSYKDKPLDFGTVALPNKLEVLNIRSSGLILDRPQRPYPLQLNFTNSLRSLDISDNLMFSFRGYYLVFDKLENVKMSNNFCSYISKEFSLSSRNVKILDAENNKLGYQLNGDMEGVTFKVFERLTNLRLRNNLIDVLSEKAFIYSKNLEVLDLSLNRLSSFKVRIDHMRNLSQLYLQENKLSTLPVELLEHMTKSSNNISIDLSNNSLTLSCANLELIRWIQGHQQYFVNVESYSFLNDSGEIIMFKDINTELLDRSCRNYTVIIVFSVIFILTFISIAVSGMVYRYRWRLRYMYYMIKARRNGYTQIPDTNEDRQYQYDVFISYANENYQFVTGELYQKLEAAGLSLCLHQKDFLPGSYIAENILQAIRNSRKVVIILTSEFLQSKWCMYEFNMARMENIYSRGDENIIFVVKFGDFDILRASPELQACLESESYLSYPEDLDERPYFWQMFVASLKRGRSQQAPTILYQRHSNVDATSRRRLDENTTLF